MPDHTHVARAQLSHYAMLLIAAAKHDGQSDSEARLAVATAMIDEGRDMLAAHAYAAVEEVAVLRAAQEAAWGVELADHG